MDRKNAEEERAQNVRKMDKNKLKENEMDCTTIIEETPIEDLLDHKEYGTVQWQEETEVNELIFE